MSEIIRIKLSFSSIYLVKGRKAILVDTGMPGEEDKILQAIAQTGGKASDISLILHTHAHVDHAGSSAVLAARLGIPTAVHRLDESMMRSGRMNPLKPLGIEARMVKLMVNRPFPPVNPDLFVDESTDLSTYGVEGRILHTPGHTAGSISVLMPSGEAIVGDLLRGGYLGGELFGTHPKYHYFADDLQAMRTSIQKIIQFKTTRLYLGHGGPLEAVAVKAYFSKDIRVEE